MEPADSHALLAGLKKGPKCVTENPFTKYQLCGTNGQYFLFGHIPSNDDKDEQTASESRLI